MFPWLILTEEKDWYGLGMSSENQYSLWVTRNFKMKRVDGLIWLNKRWADMTYQDTSVPLQTAERNSMGHFAYYREEDEINSKNSLEKILQKALMKSYETVTNLHPQLQQMYF